MLRILPPGFDSCECCDDTVDPEPPPNVALLLASNEGAAYVTAKEKDEI